MGGCSSTPTTKISNATEKELRKIVVATFFPGEYSKESGLVNPSICEDYTRQFERSAKDCAGYKWNSGCHSTRKKFLMCHFIREGVENLRKPVKEAEAAEIEKGWWGTFA